MVSNPVRLRILTRRGDFLRTFQSGKKIRPSPWVVFNVFDRDAFVRSSGRLDAVSDGGFRCGWTCSKVVGNAVIRNRLKRWSREWCRQKLKSLVDQNLNVPNVDLNVGFRGMPAEYFRKMKYSEFCEVMDKGWNLILGNKR